MTCRNLPVQLTSFVGRDAELDRARRPAGAGAAGDAVRARRRRQDQAGVAGRRRARPTFPGGVWWVELRQSRRRGRGRRGCRGSGRSARRAGPRPAARRSWSISPTGGRCCAWTTRSTWSRRPRSQPKRSSAVALLSRSLVTSREPLGVPGEVVWRVRPWPTTTPWRSSSTGRASFGRRSCSTPTNRPPCSRLSRTSTASRSRSSWRLPGSARSAPSRSTPPSTTGSSCSSAGPATRNADNRRSPARSTGATRCLDETDRIVFRRLAVFAGGFGLDAAATVGAGGSAGAEDVLPVLGRLVDKSLVMADEHDGEVRYRLLETIRAYATARLAEAREEDRLPRPASRLVRRVRRGDRRGSRARPGRVAPRAAPGVRQPAGCARMGSGAIRRRRRPPARGVDGVAVALRPAWRRGAAVPPSSDRPRAGRSIAPPGAALDRARARGRHRRTARRRVRRRGPGARAGDRSAATRACARSASTSRRSGRSTPTSTWPANLCDEAYRAAHARRQPLRARWVPRPAGDHPRICAIDTTRRRR